MVGLKQGNKYNCVNNNNILLKLFYCYSDQFVLDEKGYGNIVGRIKDMINRGGENIFPIEIEETLHTHPDVLEAHVSLSDM
jgi:non-ribosomal peptide synthetase component E (peptide arylation enzyme)